MIKNVVFDFGNTLIRFKPKDMVALYVHNAEDAAQIETAVFRNEGWQKLDRDEITDDMFLSSVYERLPERLHEKALEVYRNWIYHLPEIEGMRNLIVRIKQEYGVHVFLLSNISRYFAAHSKDVPVLKEMEACIFSAVCGHYKPNQDIYAYMCTTFGILPEETVFIDDSGANIAVAEQYGIQGYLFDGDAQKLSVYLDTLLKQA